MRVSWKDEGTVRMFQSGVGRQGRMVGLHHDEMTEEGRVHEPHKSDHQSCYIARSTRTKRLGNRPRRQHGHDEVEATTKTA